MYLPLLNQLHNLLSFKSILVLRLGYYQYNISSGDYKSLATLLHAFFLKPISILEKAMKSTMQVLIFKDTHNGFVILYDILKEILP